MAPSFIGLRSISEMVEFKSLANAEKFIISRESASSKNGLDTRISCTQEAIVFIFVYYLTFCVKIVLFFYFHGTFIK